MLDAVQRARPTLYAARAERVWPGRDDKVLASWNAHALRGILEADRALGRDDFAALAMSNAEFLAREMIRDDGRVMRTHKDGQTRIPGFLEDQAAVALAMLATFEHSLDVRWLELARRLARVMNAEFWDDATATYYDTAASAEKLVTRPHDATDNAIPSGTSLAVELLLRLAAYDGNEEYRDRANRVMGSLAPLAERYPSAFGHLLGAAEYAITFACHSDYCDMPSPRALDIARETASAGID